MIIITGTIKVETDDEFSLVRKLLIARAERSRKDKGNIAYAFAQDLADTSRIHLIEKWQDEASLLAHLEIPDPEFSKVLENTRIESACITSYEATNEKVLMSR